MHGRWIWHSHAPVRINCKKVQLRPKIWFFIQCLKIVNFSSTLCFLAWRRLQSFFFILAHHYFLSLLYKKYLHVHTSCKKWKISCFLFFTDTQNNMNFLIDTFMQINYTLIFIQCHNTLPVMGIFMCKEIIVPMLQVSSDIF